MMDVMVSSTKTLFWDISQSNFPQEDFIDKLGFFILSANIATSAKIMRKVIFIIKLTKNCNLLHKIIVM